MLDTCVRLLPLLAGISISTTALAADENVLFDESFEQELPAADGGWNIGANAEVRTGVARTGQRALAIGAENGVEVVFQQFPASPGSQWQLSGFGLAPAALTGNPAFGIVQISFFDAAGNDLGTVETQGESVLALTSNPVDGSSPTNEWIFLDTGVATAPAGTARVDVFALYLSFNGPFQEVLFDDMKLCELEESEGELRCVQLDEPDQCVVGTRSVRLADRASVAGTIASFGTTELGVDAMSDSITSVGSVTLRNRASVSGDVATSGVVNTQAGATVSGNTDESLAKLELPTLNDIGGPAAGSGHLHVNSGTSKTLTPGSYGNVTVNGNATLVLESGDYGFKRLIVNSGAHLEYGDGTRLFLDGPMTWRGTQDGPGDLPVAIRGTGSSHFEGGWDGSVRAPNGRVVFSGNGGATYRGEQFVARDFLAQPGATVSCGASKPE